MNPVEPIAAGKPASGSLFDAALCHNTTFCEAHEAAGVPREHWKNVLAAFDATGFEVLNARQERVRRMRHEDGATFNPFEDPAQRRTPWALDMIPLPITDREWGQLEAGILQRTRLLEMVLQDVYGAQTLVQDGLLPPEMIYANPHFLRPCHGMLPPGNRRLTYYAVDLYRGEDGRFSVWRDYGSNPVGLGYALENRIVISRVFSDLYHHTQIRRLAPFFQTFHLSAVRRLAHSRDNPRIVILSSGPDGNIYFEHALLSRYLGYPLVESQDLTVRNGEVFLKKLAGLEPVDVIFRQISDDNCDPFALRQNTVNGVAGLIHAMREKRIDIINPVGSGFIDTPALAVHLPSLCRHLTGTEPLLENHPSWWCGNEADRQHVLSRMEQLDIVHALDRSGKLIDPAPAIAASPYNIMARLPLRPSTTPAWDPQSGVQYRFTLFRIFACATENGFEVMPGGLAITAGDPETLAAGSPDQQQSKDIWVRSERPVEPFSLMGGLQKVSEFLRGSDLPSRVADNLLWLGRYMERAESLVRLLRSVYRRLSGEARLADIPELAYLLNLLRAENILPPSPEEASAIPRYQALTDQLKDALFREDRPDTVLFILRRVQNAARNVRDRLSLDSWRVINRLEGFADTPSADPLELLNDTLFTLNAFSGMAMESMTRGLGWHFMDMGRRVERAINQTSLIRIGLPEISDGSTSALEALLEVADSIMTYRARYRTAFQLAPALDLLLADESNPKSLAFQCSQIAGHVEHLPRPSERRFATSEERLSLEMLTAVRLLDLNALSSTDGATFRSSLAAFLESLEARMQDFAQQISAHYLSRVPTTPHFTTIFGDTGL